MKWKNILLLCTALSFALQANCASAVEKSAKAEISRLITYANYKDGDVFVSLTSNGEVCTYGYWLNKSSAGYDSSVSMLLAAYRAKSKIYIYAFPEKR